MDVHKWIILLLLVWGVQSVRVRRKSGPNVDDHLSSGERESSAPSPAHDQEDYGGQDPAGDPEKGGTDGEPWLQNELMEDLETDYHTHRVALRGVPEPWELVYPVQVRRNEQLGLDTRDYKARNKNQHYHHTSLQLVMFGRRLKIKLELNKELLSAGLKQKRHVDETTQMITEGPVKHCYYQGKVRRIQESRVVISTCNGVNGIIQLNNETYVIKPLTRVIGANNQTRFPHVVYDASLATSSKCANKRGMWHPFTDLHRGEFLKTTKILKVQQVDRNILTELKIMELVLVSDHAMYARMNYTYSRVLHHLIMMANILDSYYKELAVQIQLVMVDVWNLRDLVPASPNVRQVLRDFLLYRERSLLAIPHDLAHLVTGSHFDYGETGMSVPDSVCSQRSVSVGRDPSDLDPQHAAAIAAHYIGHALGLVHDDETCYCPDSTGCIMAHDILRQNMAPPRHFSSCSRRAINSSLLAGLGSCLFRRPLAHIPRRPLEPGWARSWNPEDPLVSHMTYPQRCGNKVLERGEECDCGSEEECAVNDPCCDPASCLLRPWATCRSGACCHNCTVRPSNHVCRHPLTECDVPEFCDGQTGQCPPNALVQDGQACRAGSALCYRGFCHTHADQCYALWGEGATQAVDRCYEKFNPTGNFNGHCGADVKTGSHSKCDMSNIQCGLLHCMGGSAEPRVNVKKTFTLTTMVADGETFQCKVVNSRSAAVPYLGMVEDGTTCGQGYFCLNATCIAVSDIINVTCPQGDNNVTCSGRGICTTSLRCFCNHGFGGVACGEIVNKTTTIWMRPITPPTLTLPTPSVPPIPQTVWYRVLTTTTSAPPAAVIIKEPSGVSTTWLVIVLAGVVGAGVVLFAASIICYRRQSPSKLKKAQKRKLFFNRLVVPPFSPQKSPHGSVASEEIPRLISFGNLPSYKADKIKAMRKSVASETGSEVSTASQPREMTEMKVLNTFAIAKPPERGILKKFPRSADDLLQAVANSGASSRTGRSLASFTDLHAERQRLLRPVPMRDQGTQGNTMSEEGEYESLVSAQSGGESDSYDEDKKDDLTPSDDDSCFKPTPTPSPTGEEEETDNNQSDAEKSRMKRMKNIEELIREIDAQATTLAKQSVGGNGREGRVKYSLSPSNSEVEADRQYSSRGLYSYLSDCEEERSPHSPQSPANESPSHHYMPKPMPRLQRQYNPLQVDIPQNVGPFSILENNPACSTISSSSLGQTRRFPSNSSTLTAITPGSPRDIYKTPPVMPLFYRTRANSRSESPVTPQLSPGAVSTSSRLSTFSQLSRASSTPRCADATLPQPQSIVGRHNSPTNPYTGSPFSMRRSPELDLKLQLAAIPLQPITPIAHLGTLERRSPPARPPDRAQSPPPLQHRDSPLSSIRSSPNAKGSSPSPNSKNSSPKPCPLPRTPPVKPRMPSPRMDRKAAARQDESPVCSGYVTPPNNGSMNSYHGSPNPHGSPRLGARSLTGQSSPQPSVDGQHPFTAIPYRGAKHLSGGSPPTSLNRSTTDSGSDAETPKMGSPKPPPRNPHSINKVTHPLLDGYPFRASHHSLTPDIASNSEGYHSDKTENDDSIIVREIPKRDAQFAANHNHRRSAYKSGNSDSIDL